MKFDTLFKLASSFTPNDWRQVSLQFESPKNLKYSTVIDLLKQVYPKLDKKEAAYLARNELITIPKCPNCGNNIPFRTDPKPYYPEYCCMSCRSQYSNSFAEPLIVDGMRYKDFPTAMNDLGITRLELRRRIFDPNYNGYKWDCVDHDKKCIEKLKAHNPILIDKNELLKWKESGTTQKHFCSQHNMKDTDPLRYALRFFQIETSFEQVNASAREFLDDKQRFIQEFNKFSMERLADMYDVSTGTIKNYARQYGLDTSLWSNGVSKAETELFIFIKEYFPDAVQSYREIFGPNGIELDIFIPSKNIGIEFNGVFTHSDKNKRKDYHRQKHLKYREKQIRYIQIWEDDWTYRNAKVKKFLLNALGFNQNRIGARKTSVREISQTEFDLFMNENHMQGKCKAKYRIGLFKDGVLLSAMGFKEIPSNTNSYSDGKGIDLIRFANTNVTGAFTKLLNHFEKTHSYDYVLSYGDLEIVSPFSNVYTNNGFEFLKEIKEDYRYFNRKTKIREHKFNWRKSAFEKLGIDINGKTEFQMADEYGLLRCYDSGKILYIKKIQNHSNSVNTLIELDF